MAWQFALLAAGEIVAEPLELQCCGGPRDTSPLSSFNSVGFAVRCRPGGGLVSVTSDLRVPVAGTLTARPDSGAFESSLRLTDTSASVHRYSVNP